MTRGTGTATGTAGLNETIDPTGNVLPAESAFIEIATGSDTGTGTRTTIVKTIILKDDPGRNRIAVGIGDAIGVGTTRIVLLDITAGMGFPVTGIVRRMVAMERKSIGLVRATQEPDLHLHVLSAHRLDITRGNAACQRMKKAQMRAGLRKPKRRRRTKTNTGQELFKFAKKFATFSL